MLPSSARRAAAAAAAALVMLLVAVVASMPARHPAPAARRAPASPHTDLKHLLAMSAGITATTLAVNTASNMVVDWIDDGGLNVRQHWRDHKARKRQKKDEQQRAKTLLAVKRYVAHKRTVGAARPAAPKTNVTEPENARANTTKPMQGRSNGTQPEEGRGNGTEVTHAWFTTLPVVMIPGA